MAAHMICSECGAETKVINTEHENGEMVVTYNIIKPHETWCSGYISAEDQRRTAAFNMRPDFTDIPVSQHDVRHY